MSKDTKKQRETLVLVVIGIGANGYRRDLSIMEGHHQDKSGCCGFPKHLKGRGLQGGRLIIFDTYRGGWWSRLPGSIPRRGGIAAWFLHTVESRLTFWLARRRDID